MLRLYRSRRGSALVSSIFALTTVTFFGATLMALSMTAFRRGREDLLRGQALHVAEAGIDRAIHFLRNGPPSGANDGTWRTEAYSETLADGRTYTFSLLDGAGDNSGRVVIDCTGAATLGPRTQTRRLSAVVTRMEEDNGAWNHLIYGGVGQAGKSVNGNIVMNGRITLLGDGEPFTDVDQDQHWDNAESYDDNNLNGQYDTTESYIDSDQDGHRDGQEPFIDMNGNGVCDPPLTVTDMAEGISGTASVGNNYGGMPSTLKTLVPSCPSQSFGGEVVESLSAKLRVKHGRVDISGSATAGAPNATGGSPKVKETLNGVYVNDGFGGNKGASSVYCDNGTSRGYDLGDSLSFPDVLTPTTIDGVSYDTHMDYLAAKGLTINGALTLKPDETYGPVSDAHGNRLYVNGSTGTMEISGIVRVTGDVNLSRGHGSGNDTFRYSGRGTLASTGSIYVHTHVLPSTGFPDPDALGLLARHRLELATGGGDSQLNMIGAFYAQEKIVSANQNQIAGTFVSSYYEMTNVPHMWQVPRLAYRGASGAYAYLPPGLPGGQAKLDIDLEVNGTKTVW